MEFIKRCSVGDVFVGVRLNDKDEYECISGVMVDGNMSEEQEKILIDYYSGLIDEDYVAEDYDDAIDEMQTRLIELLNDYFEEENPKMIS